MWIVCQADDSHEMSRLVFSEKKKNKNILECRLLQIVLGASTVKSYLLKGYRYLLRKKNEMFNKFSPPPMRFEHRT